MASVRKQRNPSLALHTQYTRHGQMLKEFLFEGTTFATSALLELIQLSSRTSNDRRFCCGARSDQFWSMTADLSTYIEGELAASTSNENQLDKNCWSGSTTRPITELPWHRSIVLISRFHGVTSFLSSCIVRSVSGTKKSSPIP